MGKLIPARYIGEHELTLSKYGGPYLDGDGKPRLDLHLRQGDTLMMLEEETIGFTVLLDPRHINDPITLGPGRVIREEDRDRTAPEISAMGYQFHEGRPDFEPVVKAVPLKKESAKDGK